MITFLTLFLGLATGSRPVQVAVGPGVAQVEIRLDGRSIATLTNPPWKASVDFGPDPEPHELLAIGRDAGGREVARARQTVNLPRQPVEASLLLLPGTGGNGRSARLAWESPFGPPERVVVTFDGRPLTLAPSREIALPDYVPEQVHFLRAELEFPENLVASAEILFGGRQKDESGSNLTGIPVRFEGRERTAAELEEAFLAGGRPARVEAVEAGSGEILVVRDEEARQPLANLPRRLAVGLLFRPNQRLQFCWPVTRAAGEVSEGYDVFMRSRSVEWNPREVQAMLAVPPAPAVSKTPRFADAISVAALTAAGRNRARAVLFLYGGTTDSSHLAPEAVRRYLARLRVPLHVWAVDSRSAKKAEKWGPVAVVRDSATFLAAGTALLDDVTKQRIVWLEGAHLPQSITVSPSAKGIRIAE